MTLNSYKFEFLKFGRYSLDGADGCSNLRYRPNIALFSWFREFGRQPWWTNEDNLFSCFDEKKKYELSNNNVILFTVAEWFGTVLAIARSRVRIPPVAAVYQIPMPTQRAIPPGSVNEYQQKLGSKWAYHAIHWPYLWSCGFGWCPAEG